MDKPIIFFDGVCNLCNGSVRTIIKWDHKRRFYFASLQSDFAKNILKDYNINHTEPNSIVLLEDGIVYKKSEAVFKIIRNLGWLKFFFIFSLLPSHFSNFIYDFIARNRYRWFGKTVRCMVPTPEQKERFLD